MNITVTIPVGPNPAYRKYLGECLDSVRAQSIKPDEILVIDDMAKLEQHEVGDDVRIWKSPWLLGVAHAFNFGWALARNNLVVMLGSDDKLHPWCLEDAVTTYRRNPDEKGYYYFDVEYSDGRTQSIACHAAMVTKGLLELTGGFPVQAAVGASDTMLVSIMLGAKGKAGNIRNIVSKTPPYWYRVHEETDTATKGDWQGVIFEVRDLVTREWKEPYWSKNGCTTI